jgi:hypothetical protein
MKSEHNHNIEQVASIISESSWEYDFNSAEEFARKQNDGDGWSFDVRYGSEAGHSNWTRIEGLKLSTEDLAAAVRLAQEWESGDKYATAASLR